MNEDCITMVMPTYNHPSYIGFFLERSLAFYTGKLFKFEVHDSSTDSQTKDLIEKFNESHGNVVRYFRYDSALGGDEKAFKALSNCASRHLYLMGDGISPDFNKLEDFLVSHKYAQYDILGIQPPEFARRFKKDNFALDTVYDEYSAQMFFAKFFHEFTLYGGSIISQKIWSYVVQNGIFQKYEYEGRHCFAYCSSLFEAIALSQFKFGMSFVSSFGFNPMKKQSTWMVGEAYYKIALSEFDHDIAALPDFYSSKKRDMLRKNRATFWGFRSMVFLKMKENLNFKLLRKYKKELSLFKATYWKYLFFAIPPTWMVKAARKGKRLCKKILRKGNKQ